MAEVFGRVLYNNLANADNNYTYSGSTVTGKLPDNCNDWLSYSYFEAQASATTTLDFTIANGGDIDSWAYYIGTYTGTGTSTVSISYESSASVFTQLDTVTTTSGKLELRTFNEVTLVAGRRIRYTFTVGTENLIVRQLAAGQVLTFQRGQRDGVKPPVLLGGVVSNNVIAQNGQIIGKNIRRTERDMKLDIQPVTETWVRNSWDDFAREAARHAFFYQWNPTSYPNDAVLAAADDIIPPVNIMPPPYMSVSMPLRVLVADQYDVI